MADNGVSQTKAQLAGGGFVTSLTGKFRLYSPLPKSYQAYRTIAKDPTIKMAVDFATAPIIAADEEIEADDDVSEDVIKFVQGEWDKVKYKFKEHALLDSLYFGWCGFEKVFEEKNGYICLSELKHLLPDITALLIDINTGELWGVMQPLISGYAGVGTMGMPIELDTDYAMVLSWRPIGSQWYGQSTLEVARATYNDYQDANEGAKRYDQYVAGAHWIVHYPSGTVSEFNGEVNVPCSEVAAQILTDLESNSAISIPQPIQEAENNLNREIMGWKIEIIGDATQRQPGFLDRLKYFDTLKCRALSIPERAILEGTMGTKAEAETHGDIAMIIMSIKHQWLCDEANKQVIDQLVKLNFGEEMCGKVRIAPAPLVDTEKAYLKTVLDKMIVSPETQKLVGVDSLFDMLGVPKNDEVATTDDVETVDELAPGPSPEAPEETEMTPIPGEVEK